MVPSSPPFDVPELLDPNVHLGRGSEEIVVDRGGLKKNRVFARGERDLDGALVGDHKKLSVYNYMDVIRLPLLVIAVLNGDRALDRGILFGGENLDGGVGPGRNGR